MKRGAALAALLLAAPALAQSGQPPLPTLMTARAVAALPAAKPDRILHYGDSPAQRIELFLPRADAASPDALRPVVVTIHGGCWRADTGGRDIMRAAVAAFVEKGWAVWNIGYRRIGEEGGGYPGTYQDVAAAIDALRDHAGEAGLDPDRVVLFGHSAGGHLGLWAAARGRIRTGPLAAEDPLKPRGVVSVGGFGDLKASAPVLNAACGEDTVSALVGEGDDDRADPFTDTSPAAMLPGRVQVVMLHGVFDGLAAPAVGLAHAAAARRAGDRAEVQIAPVSGHYEGIAPGTAAFAQGVAAVERLLAQ